MHHLAAKIKENRRKILAFGRFSVQWFLGRKLGYFGKPIIPSRRSCDSAPDGPVFSPKTRNSDRMPGGEPLSFAPDAVLFKFSATMGKPHGAPPWGNPHPAGGPLLFAQGAFQVGDLPYLLRVPARWCKNSPNNSISMCLYFQPHLGLVSS